MNDGHSASLSRVVYNVHAHEANVGSKRPQSCTLHKTGYLTPTLTVSCTLHKTGCLAPTLTVHSEGPVPVILGDTRKGGKNRKDDVPPVYVVDRVEVLPVFRILEVV